MFGSETEFGGEPSGAFNIRIFQIIPIKDKNDSLFPCRGPIRYPCGPGSARLGPASLKDNNGLNFIQILFHRQFIENARAEQEAVCPFKALSDDLIVLLNPQHQALEFGCGADKNDRQIEKFNVSKAANDEWTDSLLFVAVSRPPGRGARWEIKEWRACPVPSRRLRAAAAHRLTIIQVCSGARASPESVRSLSPQNAIITNNDGSARRANHFNLQRARQRTIGGDFDHNHGSLLCSTFWPASFALCY